MSLLFLSSLRFWVLLVFLDDFPTMIIADFGENYHQKFYIPLLGFNIFTTLNHQVFLGTGGQGKFAILIHH